MVYAGFNAQSAIDKTRKHQQIKGDRPMHKALQFEIAFVEENIKQLKVIIEAQCTMMILESDFDEYMEKATYIQGKIQDLSEEVARLDCLKSLASVI
jgi:hypothetical protein